MTSSIRPHTRNRRGEGALLRAEILAAATELVDDGGDERAVTLRAVARRTGIAAPSIYPHFPDQPALMVAVVRQAFAELADRLRCAAERAGAGSRRRLLSVCAAYLGFARDHPERYRLMFDGAWKPVLGCGGLTIDMVVALGAASLELIGGLLRDCVIEGHGDSTEPAADAIALWLGLHGLAHQRAVCTPFPWPADITQRITIPLCHLRNGRPQP
ncbi:TetR/AcrR family transcriptional regulator [Crossiella sp. CA-258035]|uniref:TetR/AcrR family transcriptional regulator n=1 Tax=Crossiella sp. CA-258035 TaxID=2981138 RepID=UPI0024BC268B|nr:TetR/AcrR family transcriptional regulator [Crossiella sp. CA-258035]WHT20174.1 TetR/AcrR family transcriptional regulator [Crossiella sp. CA-258035]